jgi:hypothetical protein
MARNLRCSLKSLFINFVTHNFCEICHHAPFLKDVLSHTQLFLNKRIFIVMSISRFATHWARTSASVILIASLAACGGGSGSSNKASEQPKPSLGSTSSLNSSSVSSIPIDITPADFSFSDAESPSSCDFIESNSILVSDINHAAPISVSGGEYAIGEGDYTHAVGVVSDGQSVKVRVACAEVGGTSKIATLIIGGVSATFTGTTGIDTSLDAITFLPEENAELDTLYESNTITISGINVEIPISITNGEYSINGGAYTSEAGTVSAGQNITLRVKSSNQISTVSTQMDSTATLTLGSGDTAIQASYRVTTLKDTTPPVAQFMFPPPVSMTEGSDIFSRIKFTDDYSTLTQVQYVLNDQAPVEIDLTTAEFSQQQDGSWMLHYTFPLETGVDNILKIVTTDDAGNTSEIADATKIRIRQDINSRTFPHSKLFRLSASNMILDIHESRERLLFIPYNENNFRSQTISQLNLNTGEVSPLWTMPDVTVDLQSMKIDPKNNNILWIGATDKWDILFPLNLNSSEVGYDRVIGGKEGLNRFNTYPGFSEAFPYYDEADNLFYLYIDFSGVSNVYKVSTDGIGVSLFSDNENLDFGPKIGRELELVFDKNNNQYLVRSEYGNILAVNKYSGIRTEIVSTDSNKYFQDFSISQSGDNIFATHGIISSGYATEILSIDAKTGLKKILFNSRESNSPNTLDMLGEILSHSDDKYFLVKSSAISETSVFAVDIETGYRVYLMNNDSAR